MVNGPIGWTDRNVIWKESIAASHLRLVQPCVRGRLHGSCTEHASTDSELGLSRSFSVQYGRLGDWVPPKKVPIDDGHSTLSLQRTVVIGSLNPAHHPNLVHSVNSVNSPEPCWESLDEDPISPTGPLGSVCDGG